MLPHLRSFYQRHQRWMPILFFLLGFAFDAVMLHRIDEPLVLVQQAIYLAIAAALIGYEVVAMTRELAAPRWLVKVWQYREGFLHFILGTLLNSYTIFYFKSASSFASFSFIVLLVALLLINEFRRFREARVRVLMALLALSLISYLVSLVPILWGSIGRWPFLASLGLSAAVFHAYVVLLRKWIPGFPAVARDHVVRPFWAIFGIFAALYFAHAIPPVPLSIKYMGVFHGLRKINGEYELQFTRPAWKFWQKGDQSFAARPGDEIYCFAQVYLPTRFKEPLQVRWLRYDERLGWESSDAIPVQMWGGREEGYRVFTKKNNYQPGLWRVQIETREGHEVGRINFKVTLDEGTEPVESQFIRR